MRPRLAACILITFANTRRWAGRQIAFHGGTNRHAIMRRLITQIFFLLAAPLSAVLPRCRRWGASLPLNLPRSHAKKRAHVQISLCANDLALPARSRPRRTCSVLLFRVGISCELFERTCAERHGVGVVPTFSNVLSTVLQASPTLFSSLSADRSLKS